MAPANQNVPWSVDEVKTLRRLKAEGRFWPEIAETLERTPKACQERYRLTTAFAEQLAAYGAAPAMPPPEPPTLELDLDRLFTIGGILIGQFEPLPPAVRTLLLDWLNKKYR